MIITTDNKRVSSQVIIEDYFALIVDFGVQNDLVKHYQIYKGDTNFIEFEADFETGECRRMKLELCEHYSAKNTALIVPNAKDGSLVFNGGDVLKRGTSEFHAEEFNMILFANGLHISFSDNPSSSLAKSGDVVFGLNGEELNEIYVQHMSDIELTHLVSELAENETQ